VVGGIMLGLGRALGETMAVTFVIGNSSRFAVGLFEPGQSISSALANEFAEATGEFHMASLIELGLILFSSPSSFWLCQTPVTAPAETGRQS
jgi:phosphate transport system permease protein